MDIEVVSVEENRGIRRERDTLVVVPNSTSYLIQLRLEDGRPAYLMGPGEMPFKPGDFLATTAR